MDQLLDLAPNDEALLDEREALSNLLEHDREAVGVVALSSHDDVESELGVSQRGRVAAPVPGDSARPQTRPGDAQREGIGCSERRKGANFKQRKPLPPR